MRLKKKPKQDTYAKNKAKEFEESMKSTLAHMIYWFMVEGYPLQFSSKLSGGQVMHLDVGGSVINVKIKVKI